jgi:hypothetical protein
LSSSIVMIQEKINPSIIHVEQMNITSSLNSQVQEVPTQI